MKRTIRKQTRNDFNARIQRLDPAFAAQKPSERFDIKPWEAAPKKGFRAENPVMMAGLGGVAAFTALMGLHNPDELRSLLLTWGWPAEFLSYAMNGVAILTIGVAVLMLASVVRIFNPRATGRWNAGGIVVGALSGIMIFSMPEDFVQAGYAYLGFEDAGDVIDYAQARTLQLANIDWASVVMVSSDGK